LAGLPNASIWIALEIKSTMKQINFAYNMIGKPNFTLSQGIICKSQGFALLETLIPKTFSEVKVGTS